MEGSDFLLKKKKEKKNARMSGKRCTYSFDYILVVGHELLPCYIFFDFAVFHRLIWKLGGITCVYLLISQDG